MLALFARIAPPRCSYVNNFPTHDNPYNISLPADRDASFAFLLADFGTDTIVPGHTPCCQLDVANAMRAKRAELEAQGKSLLFVAAGGDNFYYRGLPAADAEGKERWARWAGVYYNLTDVAWLGVLGNHDLGCNDPYATCPAKAPTPTTVGGQPYACHQLDVDKGGHRAGAAHAAHFHVPDFNWVHASTPSTSRSSASTPTTAPPPASTASRPTARAARRRPRAARARRRCSARLADVAKEGEALLNATAARGGRNASAVRRVLLLQHYPHECAALVAQFVAVNAPERADRLDVRCAGFGHVQDWTTCEVAAGGAAAATAADVMVGGGARTRAATRVLYREGEGGVRRPPLRRGRRDDGRAGDDGRAIACSDADGAALSAKRRSCSTRTMRGGCARRVRRRENRQYPPRKRCASVTSSPRSAGSGSASAVG